MAWDTWTCSAAAAAASVWPLLTEAAMASAFTCSRFIRSCCITTRVSSGLISSSGGGEEGGIFSSRSAAYSPLPRSTMSLSWPGFRAKPASSSLGGIFTCWRCSVVAWAVMGGRVVTRAPAALPASGRPEPPERASSYFCTALLVWACAAASFTSPSILARTSFSVTSWPGVILTSLITAWPRSPWMGPWTWPGLMAKAAAAIFLSATAERGLSL